MLKTLVTGACVLALAGSAWAQKAPNVTDADARHLKNLAEANLAEIDAGKLAAQKATSAAVKKFAQEMVDGHTKQLQEIRKLAQSKSVELPAKPDPRHQRALEKLQGLAGADFDRRYIRMQVRDHNDARKLAERTANRASDADLKSAAQKAEPEIEQHLKMAQDLAAATKAERRAASGRTGG
jgi:putative membrane protein